MDASVIFADREHAGRLLGQRLAPLRDRHPLVLGLVRGGVVVAAQVARSLDARLDVVVARKVGAPSQPELAVGAVARGASFFDDDLIRALGITPDELAKITARAMADVERYERRFREGGAPEPLAGRTVVVVDDGLATGATATAAVRALRRHGAERIVLAVPVCALESAARLQAEADEVVCLSTPPGFRAVGQWYERFEEVGDDEVARLLREERASARSPSPP